MITTFINIIKRPGNIFLTLGFGFTIFTLLRIAPVYEILHNTFKISTLNAGRKFELFIDYVYTSFFEMSLGEEFLIIILSLATAINIVIFIAYVKRQRKVLSGKSLAASISGMVLGLFGVGCLSCGVLILAPVITFLGLGAYSQLFIRYGLMISYVGLILVIISILYLVRQLSKPLVC